MKWNVGTKIGTGFGLVLLVFLIVGAVSYQSTIQLLDASQWRKHTYEVLAQFDELLSLLQDVEIGQRSYVLVGEESYLEPYRAAIDRIEPTLQKIRTLTADNFKQQRQLDRLEPAVKTRLALSKERIEARRTNGFEAALALVKNGQGKKSMDDIRLLISEMRNEEEGLLQLRGERADASAQRARWAIGLGTLLALVLSTLAGLVIARNIARPLQELSVIAERITAGDLNVKVSINGRTDEVGVLSGTFQRMTQSLQTMAAAAELIASGDLRSTVKPQSSHDVLGNAFARMTENLREQASAMVESAGVLGSAASEIVASTCQLSSSATESAAAVTETTTTVEEVRQTAQVSTQKAKAVSDSAQKAAQFSHSGRKATEDAALGMNRIRQQMEAIAASMMRLSEQSQTIGQIITTVEDLASQSNLLAVNAAIEAAKAGEHGKGFSVVAQEVKSLAEQSRQATSQVRNILGEIQKATTGAVMATEQGGKAVEAGEKQTGAAGEAIQLLAGNVTDAAQAATQIAASSQQQFVGMEQVGVAMENIKQASLQNVASAKQLEAATRNINELGQRLKQSVARYKL